MSSTINDLLSRGQGIKRIAYSPMTDYIMTDALTAYEATTDCFMILALRGWGNNDYSGSLTINSVRIMDISGSGTSAQGSHFMEDNYNVTNWEFDTSNLLTLLYKPGLNGISFGEAVIALHPGDTVGFTASYNKKLGFSYSVYTY